MVKIVEIRDKPWEIIRRGTVRFRGKIPCIVHHLYSERRLHRWESINPNWLHVFWNKENVEEFMNNRGGDIRTKILAEFGGVAPGRFSKPFILTEFVGEDVDSYSCRIRDIMACSRGGNLEPSTQTEFINTYQHDLSLFLTALIAMTLGYVIARGKF
jgi:hypothetical protein